MNRLEELLKSEGLAWWAWAVAGTVAAAAGLEALRRHCREAEKSRLRSLWDSRPRDVVTLHMSPRATNCPSPSPFPIKLEAFLKVAGIKYVPDYSTPMSSKNKMPWITINGVDVADSQLAIEYLSEHLGKDLEAHLSETEKTISRSIRIMIEEHLYWCSVLERWVYHEGRDAVRYFPPCYFPSWYPDWLVRYMFKSFAKGKVSEQARMQGIGRHSREEVERLGKQDIRALSVYLGEKPFLLGSRPCLADLTLFGFTNYMHTCLTEDSASVFKPLFETECSNLLAHHGRFVEQFWPDYESARYGKEEEGH